MEFAFDGAVIQGPMLDPERPLLLHVQRAGQPPQDIEATVKRQVPILGRALIELTFKPHDAPS